MEEIQVHIHTTHGHSHRSVLNLGFAELIRHRIISHVLKLGIIVHSIIIGVSLGTSQSSKTLKLMGTNKEVIYDMKG